MRLLLIASFLLSAGAFAQPVFKLGKEKKKWGAQIPMGDDSPIQFRIGTRFQTMLKMTQQDDVTTNESVRTNDFYARRVRLQVEAKYKEGIKFAMDIRNDDANKQDKGESDFNVGDAYIEVKDIFSSKNLKFRAYRAKVDVSYSETVSSSKVLLIDRAYIADSAAQWVSHNRRAMNAQILGNYEKVSFQVVAGDGVYSSKFYDATGSTASNIITQSFMTGAKVRLSPFSGWKLEKMTETFFGQGQHFTLGAGYFRTGSIEYKSAGHSSKVDRGLMNSELTFHVGNFTFIAEYFKFTGVVEDFSAANPRFGSSEGHYVQAEYLLPSLSYIAPFFRIESWDKFEQADQYEQNSLIVGLNWYLKGNNIRIGLFYQEDEFDQNVRASDKAGRSFAEDKQLKLTTMWHY